MLHAFGWAALAVLGTYLALFFWGGAQAKLAVGRSIWLFGTARGRDRMAALGFRAAFALAAAGPLVWHAVPALQKLDPLWTDEGLPVLGFIGAVIAAIGASLAFTAQMAMGASWRVGVKEGETGALVQGGPFCLSRNPTFLGQYLLLIGVALAIPSIVTLAGAVLFYWSASVQIRSEEAVLSAANGAEYDAFRSSTPRWIGWPGRKWQDRRR